MTFEHSLIFYFETPRNHSRRTRPMFPWHCYTRRMTIRTSILYFCLLRGRIRVWGGGHLAELTTDLDNDVGVRALPRKGSRRSLTVPADKSLDSVEG